MTDIVNDNHGHGINVRMTSDDVMASDEAAAAACGMGLHEYREQMLDWLDSDCDDTDVSFECTLTGSMMTYDYRSLSIDADNGRYNAISAFEERRDSEFGEIRNRSIRVARRSVVVCDGVIVSETLELAVSELRLGRVGNAYLVGVTVLDDENLQFIFSDE